MGGPTPPPAWVLLLPEETANSEALENLKTPPQFTSESGEESGQKVEKSQLLSVQFTECLRVLGMGAQASKHSVRLFLLKGKKGGGSERKEVISGSEKVMQ